MINTTSLKICFKDTSYFSFYPLLNKKMFWSPTIFTLQCCNIVTIYTIKTNYYLIAFHQRFCEKFCDCIDNHKKIRPPGVHGRRGRCEPNFWRTQKYFQKKPRHTEIGANCNNLVIRRDGTFAMKLHCLKSPRKLRFCCRLWCNSSENQVS